MSHGDAALASLTSSQVSELEVLLVALCVPSSPCAVYLSAYTSRYHPKVVLRAETRALAAALARLQASLSALHRDALATSASVSPLAEHYRECLRHVDVSAPLRVTWPHTGSEPLGVARTFATPAAVLARVVCVRKLVAKSVGLLMALCERSEALAERAQAADGWRAKRVLQAFDRLVACLPRLVAHVAHLAHFIACACADVYEDGVATDVRQLQRATVCVEKAVAPVAEHAWHKAEALLQALVELSPSSQGAALSSSHEPPV